MSNRFAIIGCGRIAQRHAALAARYGVLAAVCDIDLAKAETLGRKYGATAYSDSLTLLQKEKVDITCICSPNGWHDIHSIQALEQGSHVLCEKPMALSVKRGMAMAEKARISGKKLFVVKQNRFNTPVLLLKEMLTKHQLGRILGFQMNCFWNRNPDYYSNTWKGTREWDGGILFTQFSHFIDLLHWFFGDLKQANGFRENVNHQGLIAFEDQGAALLEMENGIKGTLHYSVNAFRKNMEGSITVFGDRGTVKIGGQYLNRIDHFAVDEMEVPILETTPGPNNYGDYEGSMSNHDKVFEQLILELETPRSNLVDAEAALGTIAIIEKIYAASPLDPE